MLPRRAPRFATSASPSSKDADMDVNAPYLPPLEPTDNKPAKRRGIRTLVLWVLLVLMFVSIYQLLSVPTRPSHAHLTCPPAADPFDSVMTGFAGAVGVLVLVFFLLRWQF